MSTTKTTNQAWNLDLLFKSDDDPGLAKYRKKVKQKNYKFIDHWKNRTDYLEDPKALRKALAHLEVLGREYGSGGKEMMYWHLRSSQEQTNPRVKAKLNQLIEFLQEIENNIQFFHLKLSNIPKTKQEEFLSSPALKPYHYYLENIFKFSPHLLSEKEERILNLKYLTASHNWSELTSNLLSKHEAKVLDDQGEELTANFSQLITLRSSQNQVTRDTAAREFNKLLNNHADIAEAEINSLLQDKKVNDQLRGYHTPLQSRLLSEDIQLDTLNTLVEVVQKSFSVSHDHYQLKAQLFGKKQLKYHERNVPYGKIEKQYPFAAAAKLVTRVFSQLDQEFSSHFQAYLKQGRLDITPRKGKSMGAFCIYTTPQVPTFVLLNHTDKLRDVLTIAHEMGHALHSEYSRQNTNSFYFDTNLATAEVASTFMEDFVLEEIMQQADDELKLSLYLMKLDEDISAVQLQISLYLFETQLHNEFRQQGYLSKDQIGQMFQQHMSSYMGDFVEQSPGSENWWLYIGHLRRYFYNYQYTFGLLVSKALQALVKKDPQNIQLFKNFLSAGSSHSPATIFKQAGLDINQAQFWQKGVDEIKQNLTQAQRLAKKLKLI